jgi:hypothetical protein
MMCAGESIPRLCQLTDEGGSHYRPGYKSILAATATRCSDDKMGSADVLGYTLPVLNAIRACPYRSVGVCGCGGARCSIRKGVAVTTTECNTCVKTYVVDSGVIEDYGGELLPALTSRPRRAKAFRRRLWMCEHGGIVDLETQVLAP